MTQWEGVKNSDLTFIFPDLAAETSDGTNNLSPGPKILLGRIAHVTKPDFPLAARTSASPCAFVSEYVSLCCDSEWEYISTLNHVY